MNNDKVTEWQILFSLGSGKEDFYTENELEYEEYFEELKENGELDLIDQCVRKDYIWNEETETWDEDWVEVLFDNINNTETLDENLDIDTTYIVGSYYDEKLRGLEDELKTDDWSEVEDFAHRKLMQGNMLEIENTKTGKYRRINPDEYNEKFDGEFIVRPEELEEAKETNTIKVKWSEHRDYDDFRADIIQGELEDGRQFLSGDIGSVQVYKKGYNAIQRLNDKAKIDNEDEIDKIEKEMTYNEDDVPQQELDQINNQIYNIKEAKDTTINNKSIIKSYNETDYGWHNNATTLYGELLDGNWYSYVPDNESIEIYNAPITDKYLDTAYNYQTDDERADDEWFDKFQQEHNITNQYTQKEIFNLIDELDARYFNKSVEENKKIEERYNIYTVSEDGYNIYNSHKVDTVDTIEQAEDRVAELRAETGMGAYYEKVDEWWENNSKRLIDYVNQETPEAIANLVYNGNIDEYMDNTSKQIALDIYNQLGKEVVEKMLDNIKLDNPKFIKKESVQPAYKGKDLSDFKLMLKAFDTNGKHAQRGNWEIGRGGYDMWYEIYYNKVPVIRCINGNVEVEADGYENYAKLTAEQYGDTYNEKVEETKSIPTLKQEIEKALDKTLTSKEFGFTPEDIKDFLVLDIKQEDDTVKVEVRAELDYEAMTKLVEPLDKIVQKYDKEAYFDMEDTGIAVAYINNKSKKITECDDEEYSDETNWAEEEASEADDRFENRYMNGGNGFTANKKNEDYARTDLKDTVGWNPQKLKVSLNSARETLQELDDLMEVTFNNLYYAPGLSDEFLDELEQFEDGPLNKEYDRIKKAIRDTETKEIDNSKKPVKKSTKKKTEAVNPEEVKEEVEQDKQETGIKGDIDTEEEAKTAVKKEVYQYAKQQGLDIEKLRKQGIELSEVAELLDKVVGNMVSKSIIEYEDKTGKSVTWDYDVTNNDIDIVITEL